MRQAKRLYGLVRQITIKPANGGFGMYDTISDTSDDSIADVRDVMDGANDQGIVYQLGVDELPAEVSDIRELVHNEPEAICAIVNNNDGSVSYFGLDSVEA